MSLYAQEQTVVVLPRTTLLSLPCQACVERQVEAHQATVSVRLRLDQDLAWVTCDRGHRIRVIRAGRAQFEEATQPLW